MSLRWADVQQGEELKPWSYRVVREDLVAYAEASGDGNPIHQDEEFAKKVGLPDVIAHGMHTMARIGQFVAEWAGDSAAVVRFKTRFTAPVVVPRDGGAEVTVSGVVREKREPNIVRVSLEARSGDTTVAAAEADVTLR